MIDHKTLSAVRGFYYAGAWGTSGLDLWQHHDPELMALAVQRGKTYFPGWNVARWFLSHESYGRDPKRFLANLESGIEIFARHGIKVMPTVFNRWRDAVCDFGGVSLEHIVPELGKARTDYFEETEPAINAPWGVQRLYEDYIDTVVGAYADDPRIFAWDVCNEPLMGPQAADEDSTVRAAELKWLRWVAARIRKAGATQPLTLGCSPNPTIIRVTEPIVDFISFHPYYIHNLPPEYGELPVGTKEGFERFLDETVALAAESGKGLLANETAWGALDDLERAENLRYTLEQLTKRNLGFMAVGVHHSLTADLHAPEYGPVGWPGRLEFINADGTLRAGHEVFNDF